MPALFKSAIWVTILSEAYQAAMSSQDISWAWLQKRHIANIAKASWLTFTLIFEGAITFFLALFEEINTEMVQKRSSRGD